MINTTTRQRRSASEDDKFICELEPLLKLQATRLARHPSDQDDLIQEGLLQVWRLLMTDRVFESDAHRTRACLLTSKRAMLTFLRQRKSWHGRECANLVLLDSPADPQPSEHPLSDVIKRELSNLNGRDLEYVELRFFIALTDTDIALHWGVSPAAVHKHKVKTLRLLRCAMKAAA